MAEEQIDNDIHEEEDVDDEEQEEEQPDEAEASDDDEEEEGGDDPYANLSEEQLKTRLAKAEKAIVRNKKPKAPKQPDKPVTKQPDGDEIPEWGKKIIQSDEKRQFGYERNLSPAQVDAVFRYNGGEKPDDKTMERPEVKAMVKSLREQDRVAENTPKGGSGVVYKGKTFEQVASDKDASTADKQAAFEGAKKKHGVA